MRGLHCASCVNRLEAKLKQEPAIDSAMVNLATETAFVRFDPRRLDMAAIFALVSDTGYTPVELQEEDTTAGDDLRSQRNWMIFSLLLSLPIMFTMGMHHNRAVMQFNCLLATVLQFSAGLVFYRGAWAALRSRRHHGPAGGPGNLRRLCLLTDLLLRPARPRSAPVFFETSAMLIAFIRLGKFLEARARGKAGER